MNWIFHSLLKLAHTHESWHREEIGIYISPEGKCITFFKATCFWIIMIRIYSLQYTLFEYFFIRQFFSYFCYVNTTFFAILRSFYALWKCFYQKCATFGLFHISRLRSVLTTYVFSRFLSYYFRKGRNIQITYYVCLFCAM